MLNEHMPEHQYSYPPPPDKGKEATNITPNPIITKNKQEGRETTNITPNLVGCYNNLLLLLKNKQEGKEATNITPNPIIT